MLHCGGVPVQRAHLIGKLYRETKKEQGGDRRSEEFSSAHCEHLVKTAEVIAEQFGVGPGHT